jgi:hypothetical protein
MGHTEGLVGNDCRHLKLEIRVDYSGQIHHVIERLHVQDVGRLQFGVLDEQTFDASGDICIARATGEPAFLVDGAPPESVGDYDATEG